MHSILVFFFYQFHEVLLLRFRELRPVRLDLQFAYSRVQNKRMGNFVEFLNHSGFFK